MTLENFTENYFGLEISLHKIVHVLGYLDAVLMTAQCLVFIVNKNDDILFSGMVMIRIASGVLLVLRGKLLQHLQHK